MAEPRSPLAEAPDTALEQALRALGPEIAFPPTPDLAARSSGMLTTAQPPSANRVSRLRSSQRRWLAAAAILLLIAGTLLAFPEARTAIADRLGLRGIHLRWVEELPTPEPAPVGALLLLGDRVSLDEAQEAVSFSLLIPEQEGFADPPEVYLWRSGDEAMVSYVYPAGPELPAGEFSDAGALLTQFRGSTERAFIEKGLRNDDGQLQTRLEAITVAENPGFWIAGAPHGMFLVCENRNSGDCREERYRLAGNVLIWEVDGVTLRLESALSRAEAIAIAASMRARA